MPVLSYVLTFAWLLIWLALATWLWSVGEVEKDESLPIANIVWDDTTRYMMWYILFGLFWISAFIKGASDFVIALTAIQWYFSGSGSSTSDDKSGTSVMRSFVWTLRYHLGSVAFGSLLISIMNMIKFIFEYIRKKYAKVTGTNPVTQCLVCCLRCCIWYIDSCVKYITKNAWIQVSLSSKNFC